MYLQSTAYAPEWAKFSPGQSLLSLILKDCFETDRPEIVSFGSGEEYYKELFANQSGNEVTVLVLKRTLMNRVRIFTHRIFRKGVGAIRVWVR